MVGSRSLFATDTQELFLSLLDDSETELFCVGGLDSTCH